MAVTTDRHGRYFPAAGWKANIKLFVHGPDGSYLGEAMLVRSGNGEIETIDFR